ncbi:hypothetical protein [Thiocapsa sp.]|nr:hypothetical protein [Thiocapsa sp.]
MLAVKEVREWWAPKSASACRRSALASSAVLWITSTASPVQAS